MERIDARGFSLIEMVIVLGLMGLVSLGFSTLFVNAGRSQVGAQQTAEFLSLQFSVQQLLQDSQLDPTRCAAIFKNALGTANAVVREKNLPAPGPDEKLSRIEAGGSIVAAIGKPIAGSQVMVSDLRLDWVATLAPNRYRTMLRLYGKRAERLLRAVDIASAPLYLDVTTDATDRITACGMSATTKFVYENSCIRIHQRNNGWRYDPCTTSPPACPAGDAAMGGLNCRGTGMTFADDSSTCYQTCSISGSQMREASCSWHGELHQGYWVSGGPTCSVACDPAEVLKPGGCTVDSINYYDPKERDGKTMVASGRCKAYCLTP